MYSFRWEEPDPDDRTTTVTLSLRDLGEATEVSLTQREFATEARLEHAVKFLRLRGGDVNGDFDGVPASQLAVFPGTTHFFGLARTDLVLDVVRPFLDAPMSEQP